MGGRQSDTVENWLGHVSRSSIRGDRRDVHGSPAPETMQSVGSVGRQRRKMSTPICFDSQQQPAFEQSRRSMSAAEGPQTMLKASGLECAINRNTARCQIGQA